MSAPVPWILSLCLFAPSLALAQDDNPIPYPDNDPDEEWNRPARSTPTPDRPEVEEDVDTLAPSDDPSTGIAAELVGGVMLLDSARAIGVEARFGWGARATWELGRLFSNDVLHEGLFLDGTWLYSTLKDGTEQVFVHSNYHYFSLAPAFGLPFGRKAPVAIYAQAGGGIAYQHSTLESDKQQTLVAGIKPIFQYGVGIRGRPALGADGGFRLTFRLELTRFRRAYMDDTYLGLSLGGGF